jgi:hypothetical protein
MYYGEFTDKEQMFKSFNESSLSQKYKDIEVLIAIYSYANWEGQAFVLYRQNNQLFEVNEYHCSCHGLNNWAPEETNKEALMKRFGEYYSGLFSNYKDELKPIIEAL